MTRAMTGRFSEGEYRLAVVRNALTAPELLLFAHAGGTDWMCEFTSKHITVTERVAARLSDNPPSPTPCPIEGAPGTLHHNFCIKAAPLIFQALRYAKDSCKTPANF
jgi:hypothetical protein